MLGWFFFRWFSMWLERVPWGSLASSTWIITSEESITLYNSSHILFDWPADKMLSFGPYLWIYFWYSYEFFIIAMSLAALYFSFFSYTFFIKWSNENESNLGFLRVDLAPKVCSNGSISRRLALFTLAGVVKIDSGSFLPLTNTV